MFRVFFTNDEIEDMEDEYDNFLDEIEEAIDDKDDDVLDEFKDEFGMSAKKFLRLMDPPSLNGMKAWAKAMEGREAALAFELLIGIITGYALFIALFVALAIVFMNKPLMIVAIVLSAGFFFAFAGAVWFFIFTALGVCYTIFVGKFNKAYATRDQIAPAAEAAEQATEA
jgi:uncharacterized membrane protein